MTIRGNSFRRVPVPVPINQFVFSYKFPLTVISKDTELIVRSVPLEVSHPALDPELDFSLKKIK
jgi:hypothetical protein